MSLASAGLGGTWSGSSLASASTMFCRSGAASAMPRGRAVPCVLVSSSASAFRPVGAPCLFRFLVVRLLSSLEAVGELGVLEYEIAMGSARSVLAAPLTAILAGGAKPGKPGEPTQCRAPGREPSETETSSFRRPGSVEVHGDTRVGLSPTTASSMCRRAGAASAMPRWRAVLSVLISSAVFALRPVGAPSALLVLQYTCTNPSVFPVSPSSILRRGLPFRTPHFGTDLVYARHGRFCWQERLRTGFVSCFAVILVGVLRSLNCRSRLAFVSTSASRGC